MNEPYPLPHQDVPASQIFRAKDVRKSGMLRKKAGGFKFKLIQDPYDHRFVIIHKGWVYYYKSEKSEKQQGKFSLQGYSSNVVNAEEEEAKIQHVFKVYGRSAQTRTWYFATENEMDKREWMEAFRQEIEQYKFAATSIKSSTSSPYPRPGELQASLSPRPKSISITDGAAGGSFRGQLNSFPSSTTVESGFGSMNSFEPDGEYEPVGAELKTHSGQRNRHSADVTHLSTEWESRREFIKTRPPEPIPHQTNISSHDDSDVPNRPPPSPPPPTPPRRERDNTNLNSVSMHGVTSSKTKMFSYGSSNVPNNTGSPPFGMGKKSQPTLIFQSPFANNSNMPSLHLSDHTNPSEGLLDESPEYCEMEDMHIPAVEQQAHGVGSRLKTPFAKHFPMPSFDQGSDSPAERSLPPAARSDDLSNKSHRMQTHTSPSARFSSNQTKPHFKLDVRTEMSTDKPVVPPSERKALGSKPPPVPPGKPVSPKPALPRKPIQAAPGVKSKPVPPAKPSHITGSNQSSSGVSALRAAFESK